MEHWKQGTLLFRLHSFVLLDHFTLSFACRFMLREWTCLGASKAASVATVKVFSRTLLCFLLGASRRLTFSLASQFRVLRAHFHGVRLLVLLILLCWLGNLTVRGSLSHDLDCLLPPNEVLRYQVLKKPLKESLDDYRVLGRHQESFQMITSRSLMCFVGSKYKCIFGGFLSLLQCFLGCTSPRGHALNVCPSPQTGHLTVSSSTGWSLVA